MSDELKDKIIKLVTNGPYDNALDATIALVRAETLEEAAVVFSRYEDDPFTASTVAAHLRKMKDKP